jgi:putative ABC transport system permease protein
MTSESNRPPRIARWLLRRMLDGPARSAIIGDLDEEFARFIVPSRGRRKARRWYWQQTLTSITACAFGGAVPDREPDEPLPRAREIMQDTHGWSADVRAAFRFCFRSPLTSCAVIVTLAIGVAANTAVFSVVNATLFKKLQIAHVDRLVTVGTKDGGSFTYPEYLASRDAAGLDGLIAGGRTRATMGEGQSRRHIAVDMVTANYFTALGVAPAVRGRLLTADDDTAGRAPVVVLSYPFWSRALGADPRAVGQAIRLERTFFTVVGIAPKGFSGLQIGYSPDLWLPLTQAPLIDDNRAMLSASSAWLGMAGILARSDSLPVARDALTARWQASGVRDEAVLTLIPRGPEDGWSEPDSRLQLFSLFVALILIIACLNVSTLLGAGVHERQKELAIRSSLGAGRLRLLRQLLAEHVLLATAGGVAGGIAGVWLARGLSVMMAGPFGPSDLDVRVDFRVILFTIAVSIVSALAVGVIPAVRWSKVNLLVALQGGGTGVRRLLRSASLWWLIPWQVALGTVLLASAAMLTKTVYQLKLGIEVSAPDRVWFADLQTNAASRSPAAFADFLQQLPAHMRKMPHIEAVGLVTGRPLASVRRGPLRVEGMTTVPPSRPMPWGPPPPPPPKNGAKVKLEKLWIVSNNYVTPGFFSALSLPMIHGRDFSTEDTVNAPRVAIVNETLAAQAFGKTNPIGRRVSWAEGPFNIEIVGVVRDLRTEHLREAAPDAIFFPLAQIPQGTTVERTSTGGMEPIDLTMVARVAQGYVLHRDAMLQHIAVFDPQIFVDRVWTFDEEAGRALSQERLLAAAGSVFGGIALALMVVGLYGTLAAAVIRGRRELGIRLALGASPISLRRMIVARSLLVALAGLAIGLPLSYLSTKSFVHLLYGVQPVEPLIVGVIVVILLVTAALAAYLPARQAARVDPLIALRDE